ncbi:MAG: SAM-dependent DNA methyltransferase [Alphaproteobacteria bacterium]|nr:SAM-dependent DNA methyltransferase [Alphaproteobacteria bacterium]
MATLSTLLRRQLESTVRDARIVADGAAADAVARLAIDAAEAPSYLSDEQKALRRRLRAHARSLGDRRDSETGPMATARLAEAAAYEHWHRMLFGRFLVERNLLLHPTLGVPLSRDELKELAEEEGLPDEWTLVERFAAPTLPAVFKPDDPVLQLTLDPHFQLRLRALVTALPDEVFAADDSLGWTYQFWRAAEKKAVNEKQVKIGADELPAVTQLFTEPYMVKFLLHNTLGAWWAAKVLAADPDLARDAPDEAALRAACALPGIDWEYLRFIRDPAAAPSPSHASGVGPSLSRDAGEGQAGASEKPLSRTAGEGAGARSATAGEGDGAGLWRPAAGTFPGWPSRAAEITYLDPCCGSGHFLVEAFNILAALRRAEEGMSPEEAARAVLRDNLHGLELDGRCVQIAAFNVALAAWRLAGGPVTLPLPQIAWVGAPPPLPKAEFVALANGDAELQRGLAALHDLFRQAPLLGSLIELGGGDLVDPTRIARLDQSIAALVEKMRGAEPERAEGALAARGMADAAAILARRFIVQATNPPFLGRGQQVDALAIYLDQRFPLARADLATGFLSRMLKLSVSSGTVASVSPQNWLHIGTYRELRQELLSALTFDIYASLGMKAFAYAGTWDFNIALIALSTAPPNSTTALLGLDAAAAKDAAAKSQAAREAPVTQPVQFQQFRNPEARIVLEPPGGGPLLSSLAGSFVGLQNGDTPHWVQKFWEHPELGPRWALFQLTTSETRPFAGRHSALLWDNGIGELSRDDQARIQGRDAWGQRGVMVRGIGDLPCSLYDGDLYDQSSAAIIPANPDHLPGIWSFCSSPDFEESVRRIDRKLNVTNATLVKIPFDLAHWQKVAAERYPNGLPEPYSDDPTQWLFHGHPRCAEAGTELHVALARLAGYRWPAESDSEMRLSAAARARIAEAAALPEADAGGLLALEAVLGERPLADRLRAYCAAAWGDDWRPDSEARLVAAACERFKDKPPKQLTLDDWLRGPAARQHTKLFHDRPFLWWITDGRADGFTVVADYHRLDRGNLERLTYSMLGDWIARLGDDPRAESAKILQHKLALILEGEKPFDIFVRWKPLARQPLGWDPDLDDGVRQNIRPFLTAGVLSGITDKILKAVDRGKDVPSAPWHHLFHGERRNDHHTTLAEKRAARTKAAE